jgi:hypothetical protein
LPNSPTAELRRDRSLLTFATWPKSFVGSAARLQEAAIRTWGEAAPGCQILLFGRADGIAEAASRLGAQHVPAVPANEHNTVLLDGLIAEARILATHNLICLANADVVFIAGLMDAVNAATRAADSFLLTGRCREVPESTLEKSWEELVAEVDIAPFRDPGAIDYFVFPRDLYIDVPPLAYGRAGFDNWLLWRVRDLGAPLIDVTSEVIALHPRHDYGHLAGGRASAYAGVEAQRNVELAGGWKHLYDIEDASHRLSGGVVRPNWRGRVRTIRVVRSARLLGGRGLRRFRPKPEGVLLP